MILLVALVAAAFVALPLGGRFSRLPQLGLRGGWMMALALLPQFYAIYFPAEAGTAQFQIASVLLICSYALLLVAVWRNGHLGGMWILGLGLVLNTAVIVANGGYMPTSPEALVQSGLQKLNPGLELGTRVAQTKDILLLPADTRLWFLSDIFVMPWAWPYRAVFSLGDTLIAVGAFVLMQTGMGVGLYKRLVPAGAYIRQP